MAKFWIIVASKDHVEGGVEGGFAQACHGKASPLQRMTPGDGVLYYSSKEKFGQSEKCQTFTAIGKVKDAQIYTVDAGDGFVPSRRQVEFYEAQEAPIKPLIPNLSFIKNKEKWGSVFRFGFFEVPQEDFLLIAQGMLAEGTEAQWN